MRSPCRIGEECPCGSGSFHSRFLSWPNSVGTFVAVEIPEPLGPRKRDQSGGPAAPADAGKAKGKRQKAKRQKAKRRKAKGARQNSEGTRRKPSSLCLLPCALCLPSERSGGNCIAAV